MRPVLILGGYGNFGKRIAEALTRDGIPVIIAGRSAEKAADFKRELQQELPACLVSVAVFDAKVGLEANLQETRPCVVINTCGPFQTADYTIANACIHRATNYIDLADGRDFVTGISKLNKVALAQDRKSVV